MANVNHLTRLSEDAERQRASWQFRAIQKLKGNRTVLGAILLAALDKAASNPPRVLSGAVIDTDGTVYAYYQEPSETTEQGFENGPRPLVKVEALIEEFRRLAYELKFTSQESEALFFELRAWINDDKRAEPSKLGPNLDEV